MTRCGRCGTAGAFLFTCGECGGEYCADHRSAADHLCITFPPLGSDDATAGPCGVAAPPAGRVVRIAPAGGWLFAVLSVELRDVALGPADTVALVAAGSVALWLAATSMPRLGAWMHAGG